MQKKNSANPEYMDQSQARWPSIKFQYKMYVYIGGITYGELEHQIRLALLKNAVEAFKVF